MNKYEIKAAYNKIALSDEFKVSAKQKLLASFEDRSVDDEAVNEYHTPTSVKLTATSRSAWKTAAAVCSAAAVLGFGVWGACVLNNEKLLSPAQQGDSADNDIITKQDIESCKKTLEKDGISVLDTVLCDLDFDDRDEILLLSSFGGNQIHVFEKNDGELSEDSVFGMGMLNYIEKLELYPYSDDEESYHYFSFHFDNGGVMAADVLTAIRPQDGYAVEYLLSHGTLSYSDISEPFSEEFYRKGWNKDDIAIGEDDFDLTRAEYEKLYEKYRYAPPLPPVKSELLAECMVLDYYYAESMPWDRTQSFYVEGYPEVQFIWSNESIKAVYADGSEKAIITGMPIWSVYLSDLSGDGKQEICCGVSFGSGIIDDSIIVYDYAQGKQYELSDRGKHDYCLRMDIDKLIAVERAYSTVHQTRYGELALTETADGEYELVIAEQNVPETLNDIHEFNHYVSAGEVYHTVDTNGTQNESVEDIREVRLDFILPLYWTHEWNDYGYLQGAAYFNGVKIFEHARPVCADVEIDPNFLFNTDYADCKKVTVHEEEWGTDDDLFKYYIHTSTPSEYEDDGSLDEYKYVVNSGGYNITLTFIADIGLQQETIDSILGSIQMTEQE